MTFAFLFPGQGSQSVGMMSAFSELSVVKDTFEEASSIMQKDMWQLAQAGAQEELAITTNTQPLMLTSDVAVYRAWVELGGHSPSIVAGHSLGEYAALVTAGALVFSDAVSLVQKRSTLMQNAVPSGIGAMAAVLGLSDEEKTLGAKRAMLLAMATPSHCSLIKPAADLYLLALKEASINTPNIPVIHNYNVLPSATAEDIRDWLYQQLFSPVRWVETIQYITAMDIKVGFECGPGKVITGLNKRIDKELHMIPLGSPKEMELAINELSRSNG